MEIFNAILRVTVPFSFPLQNCTSRQSRQFALSLVIVQNQLHVHPVYLVVLALVLTAAA